MRQPLTQGLEDLLWVSPSSFPKRAPPPAPCPGVLSGVSRLPILLQPGPCPPSNASPSSTERFIAVYEQFLSIYHRRYIARQILGTQAEVLRGEFYCC